MLIGWRSCCLRSFSESGNRYVYQSDMVSVTSSAAVISPVEDVIVRFSVAAIGDAVWSMSGSPAG